MALPKGNEARWTQFKISHWVPVIDYFLVVDNDKEIIATLVFLAILFPLRKTKL